MGPIRRAIKRWREQPLRDRPVVNAIIDRIAPKPKKTAWDYLIELIGRVLEAVLGKKT